MGCGSSSSVKQDASADVPVRSVIVGEKQTHHQQPQPAGSNEMSADPYVAADLPLDSTQPSDFHSIATAPMSANANGGSGTAGGLVGSPPKKKKKGDTIGIGKQAGSTDLSSQLTNLDSDRAMNLFDRYLVAVNSVSAETNMTRATEIIIEQACRVLDCTRASLFLVDNETDELELIVGKGAKNIRMPKTKGLAGHCATTGETVLIPDAHLDSRFDPSFDQASGFRTRAVIACPVRDKAGEIVGVLQCINHNPPTHAGTALPPGQEGTAPFGQLERILCENFASHTGLVLRNCQLYEESRAARQKVETLLDIVQLLHSDPNTNSLIFTLTNRAHTLVDGDRSTLYLVHRPTAHLVVQQGNVDIKIPMAKGLAGHVATTGRLVNIPDCYAPTETRFDKSVDAKTGYRTRAMLCMPIFGPRPSGSLKAPTPADVIGVLQLINKKDESTFTEADERLLRTLLDLSGPILAASSFFAQQATPQTEAERMRNGAPSPRTAAAAAAAAVGGGASSTSPRSSGGGGGSAISPASKQRPAAMRRVTETEAELEPKVRQMAALGEELDHEEELEA